MLKYKNRPVYPANDLTGHLDSTSYYQRFCCPLTLRWLKVFGGYAEKLCATKRCGIRTWWYSLVSWSLKPQITFDLGLRYSARDFKASVTYYTIKFDNRITFIINEDVDGIDFLDQQQVDLLNTVYWILMELKPSIKNYNVKRKSYLRFHILKNDSTYTDVDFRVIPTRPARQDMAVLSFDTGQRWFLCWF